MSPPLILVPGMMCDDRLFAPQIKLLGGHVHVPSAADTITDMAAELLKVAPQRFALAGLSLGGIVAMEVVRQAPERVVGLALMDTNPLPEADMIKARRGPQMDKVRAGHLVEVMRDEMKPNYLAQGPDRDRVLDLCMAMALSLGPDVFLRQSRALRDRPDQCDTLRRYAGPSLVLCGAEDRLCPPSRHEMMRGLLTRSTLKVIDGAGHLPTLEQPGRTNAALRAWMEDLENG